MRTLADMVKRAWSFAGSRAFSFWVLGAWIALTAVWLVPFQVTGQPLQTVQAIAEEWLAFQVVYALVALATVLCGFSRLRRDWRRVTDPRQAGDPPAGSWGPLRLSLDDAAATLTASRYRVERTAAGAYAMRHRAALLGGSAFHFGIVVLGASLVLHSMTVSSVSVRVTEGQTFGDAAAAEEQPVGLPLDVSELTLESIEPLYHEDVLLFTRLDATVLDGAGERSTFSLSRPMWMDALTLLSVQDYGLAPHIAVEDPSGETDERVVAMSVFPPGSEDTFEPLLAPFSVAVVAYPDYGVVDGRDVSLSYNITEPKFLVAALERGPSRRLLARELIGIGEPMVVGDYSVTISGLSRYGTFRLSDAPAVPLVAVGLLMSGFGMSWRALRRRHDVRIWERPDGLYVDSWLDLGGRTPGLERARALLTSECDDS